MFAYICIAICFLIARNSRQEYRAIAYLMLFEFSAHQLTYIIGEQWLKIPGIWLYTIYAMIELLAIVALRLFQSHLAIMALIIISLVYNVLVVSQYKLPVYDYMENYKTVMRSVMILEMLYLGMLTAYVGNFRRKHGFISTTHIDRMFSVRRRNCNGCLS